MTWAVDLQDRSGGAVASDLPLAALRTVWSLDGPGSFECELGEDDAVSWLAGQRRVVVRRTPTPDQLSGLVAWYDASAITGLADAATVGTWADRSGNGNDATQATEASKPRYRKTVNLLPLRNQADVETDTSGFGANAATVTMDTAEAFQGVASLKVDPNGGAGGEGTYLNDRPLVAPGAYTFSAYLKGSGTVKLGIEEYTAAGVYNGVVTEGAPITLTSTWTRYSVTVPSLAGGTARLGPRIYTSGVSPDPFWADALQLESGSSASDFDALRDRPTLRFDGVDDHLAADAVAAAFSGSDEPISFLVVCQARVPNTHVIAGLGRASSTDPYVYWTTADPANDWSMDMRDDAALEVKVGGGTTDALAHVFSAVHTGTQTTLALDGTIIQQDVAQNVGTKTLDRFSIGSAQIGAAEVGHGAWDISEILVFDRALTDDERQIVEDYLGRKYDVDVPVYGGSTTAPAWTGWLNGLKESTRSFDDLSRPRGTLLRGSALGLASVLDRRVVHGDFSKVSTVATTAAWDLIDHAQNQTDGDHGFTLGTVTGTAPARTRHYCDGDSIVEAIQELAQMDPGGFDWEIDETGAFNAWVGGRGVVTAYTLERADAMTWDVVHDLTEFVTYATALGDRNDETPCGAPLVIRSSAVASTYERREVVEHVDTNDSGELTEVADEALRSRGAALTRVKATWPENDPPWMWGAVWLGDHVTVDLPAHFGGTQTMRVIEIAVSVEPPAFGYVEYEFEAV